MNVKKQIEVRSQAEFEACVSAGSIAIVIGCSVVAWGNSSVVARGNSSVEARGNSSVEAWENSSVVAWGNSSVVARGNSSVVARGNSSVVARGNSSVEAWENSSVEAWENSSVVAWGNSSVEAWENSSVEAWGSVFVRLFSALRIKASAYVTIVTHGVAREIEGGRVLPCAPDPVTGADWCDYYGIEKDSAFRVPDIDAAILALITAENSKGLDMSSWHGDEKCDETNWCSTTHCRAGFAICLAGAPGWALRKKYGDEMAGRMIYAVSRPDMPLPDFHATNKDALEDMRRCAGVGEAVEA